MYRSHLLWLLVILGIASTEALCSSTIALNDLGKESVACGPRTVLLLMRAQGIKIDYDEIRSAIPVTDDGASIQDLVVFLNLRGIKCDARRVGPSELLMCRTPLIAYLSSSYTGKLGHFVYVDSVSNKGVYAIDPILGKNFFWGWRSFSDAFGGVCIMVERPTWDALDGLLIVSTLHLLAIGATILIPVSSYWTSIRGRRVGLFWSIVIIPLCVTSNVGVSQAGNVKDENTLRSNRRGGVNAVELMAHCLSDRSQSRAVSVDRSVEVSSFADLQSELDRLGWSTSLRQMSFRELLSIADPMIVMLRHGTDSEGDFCLIVKSDKNEVSVIRTGPLIVEVLSVDEFRHRWTGHVLISAKDGDSFKIAMIAICFGLGLTVVRLTKTDVFRRRHNEDSVIEVKHRVPSS